MLKQFLYFQKSAFDNSIQTMTQMQQQNEKMIGSLVSQSPFLTEEGKKAIETWEKTCRKGREDFIKSVETNFDKMIRYFEDPVDAE
jgi:hypothetical protein